MQVYKNAYNGWCAESTVPVGDRVIRITTMKRSNGMLATTASAGKQDGYSFTFVVFEDFSKTLCLQKVRCSEKAVRLQHSQVDTTALVAEVEAYYA